MNNMDRKKKKELRNTIIASIFLVVLLAGVLYFYINHSELLEKEFTPPDLPFVQSTILDHNLAHEQYGAYVSSYKRVNIKSTPYKVRGIYISPKAIQNEERIDDLIKYAHRNNINAFIIDMKDDFGNIVYPSMIKKVEEYEANNVYIEDIDALLDKLKKNNIYPIARVVCFKDGRTGKNKDLSILNNKGELWYDGRRTPWLNPYNPKAIDYLLSIIKEISILGFKDIQLDYVRFPTEGKLSSIQYDTEVSKSDAINDFVNRARGVAYGAELSIDTFGMITSVRGDLGIGQDLNELIDHCDIMSPMVYPSHYSKGNFNLDYPDSYPYEVIYGAVSDAIERIDFEDDMTTARLRPWLQSFSATWLRRSYGSKYREYGTEEVLLQIEALQDLGIDEWMLWNPLSNYPELGG